MTHQHGSSSAGGESNLAPGVAPSFGDVPAFPFEHTPKRLVLSLSEHHQLEAAVRPEDFGGAFEHELFGAGTLLLKRADAPGEVHLSADVVIRQGPAMRLDATVRQSWVMRSVAGDDAAPPNVRIVRELVRVASLPHQSTVRVSVALD